MLPSLYAELLGDAWPRLAAPVRRLHGGGARVEGVFRVRHGAGWLARFLASVFRMPRACERVIVKLAVERRGEQEIWTRAFGEHPVRTVQWARGGLMLEALGPVICIFRLREEGAALVFDQIGARFGGPRFAVPLPRFLAPFVVGRSEAGAGVHAGVKVDVRIHAPGVGLLVAYEGDVEVPS
jgi:hypothetical protein